MLFNLFSFTVTISKRQYSSTELNKANRMNKVERNLNEMKSKQFEQQVWSYLGRN